MSEFHPYITQDGSVGLYSESYNDIYHSATGALTEAYEKFVYPINFENLLHKEEIKLLDICYGIGYNSKSFLNYIFENYFSKKTSLTKNNIVQIHTNKTSSKNHPNDTDTIHTDNIFPKIYIKAVDNDKLLTYLSPFIKTGVKVKKNIDYDFEYNKILKYLKVESPVKMPKINKLINFLIFEKIAEKCDDFYTNSEVASIINNKQYKAYLDGQLCSLYKISQKNLSNAPNKPLIMPYLHNIYYKYISNRNKRLLKGSKLADIDFTLEIDDARQVIQKDNNLYDLIFLDAFSPAKCPCLWSYEFFCQLYSHLDVDGMLMTYSKSAAVRGAMLEAGFKIGNIMSNDNKVIGTIAAKNLALIKHDLSEFDLGLIKTRAGIFYRDKNLTGLNEALTSCRNLEVKISDRISSSRYMKEKGVFHG
ncbi:MAG: MnmC family methyltransferase [Candidatus Gastranaerophilaceae bacterium]